MEFHLGKCQVLTISRTHKPVQYDYNLHGIVLEHVTLAMHLGLTIQHDMKWNNKITSSANRSLGFLRRNLQVNSHYLKTMAYNALVRLLLEYAPSVWDPHTKQGISTIYPVMCGCTLMRNLAEIQFRDLIFKIKSLTGLYLKFEYRGVEHIVCLTAIEITLAQQRCWVNLGGPHLRKGIDTSIWLCYLSSETG